MAISPPTDILLDVATAADPAKVRAATERLARLAADPTATNAGFTAALRSAGDPSANAVRGATPSTEAQRAPMRTMVQAKTNAYQKFEAMMLQNFVEQMLPQGDDLYGDKASSDAYRSMMAEQLATQLAKAGGVGIARMLERAHPDQAQQTTSLSPTAPHPT